MTHEDEETQHEISKLQEQVHQISLWQRPTKNEMEVLKKGMETKMDGLKKGVESKPPPRTVIDPAPGPTMVMPRALTSGGKAEPSWMVPVTAKVMVSCRPSALACLMQ